MKFTGSLFLTYGKRATFIQSIFRFTVLLILDFKENIVILVLSFRETCHNMQNTYNGIVINCDNMQSLIADMTEVLSLLYMALTSRVTCGVAAISS